MDDLICKKRGYHNKASYKKFCGSDRLADYEVRLLTEVKEACDRTLRRWKREGRLIDLGDEFEYNAETGSHRFF